MDVNKIQGFIRIKRIATWGQLIARIILVLILLIYTLSYFSH